MRPAWRLGINTLSARRSRTALLVGAVAMSAALIAAVSCALASMHEGLRARIESTVGAADVRVQRVGRVPMDAAMLARVRAWPEVAHAAGRAVGPILLKHPRTGKESATVGHGVDASMDALFRELQIEQGEFPRGAGQIAIDQTTAKQLEASVGDVLEVQRWGDPISLTIVGVVTTPSLGLGLEARPETYVTLDTLGTITDKPGAVREIDVILKHGFEPERVAAAYEGTLGQGVLVRPSSKITSGLADSQRSSRLGMTIASALAMLAAAFIIMTGLTTGVTERLRELAMVRCIGGTRWQLAESQLVIGLVVGAIGSVVGVPLGVLGAYLLVRVFPGQFPGGFTVNPLGLTLGIAAAIFAGLLGAIYPAFRAAHTSPLEALAARSRPATLRGIVLSAVLGLVLVAVHLAIFIFASSGDVLFAADLAFGLPAMFAGYFLLAVGVLWVVTTVIGSAVSRAIHTPAGMLVRTMHATPYRFGFTAGAMALGLAMLVAIWTNGRSIDRDWLSQFKFPDAFAAGLISEDTQKRIAALPFVEKTTAITEMSFKTDAFGLKFMDYSGTSFIAFEPDEFLSMARLQWIEGDPETARKRLNQGGAVLVAREFRTTRGLGVGDKITLGFEGKPYEFEIVGVVNSPGLDIVNSYFEIGDEFLDMKVNAVFGSREDLKRLFNNTSVRLIQIDFKDGPEFANLTDEEAIRQVRRAGGAEVLSAGSGREIIRNIRAYIEAALYVFSLVGVAAMLVACFGVANLIVAGIQARQYEFGVLRAIGAERGTVARLVLGEALLIAVAACIVGTVMGTQAAWAGQRMNQALMGIQMTIAIPPGPVAAGWATVTAITIGAALPAVLALNRKKPRELLGVVRG